MILPLHEEKAKDSGRLPTSLELLTIVREKRLGFSSLAVLLVLRSGIAETEEKVNLSCVFTTQQALADEIGVSRAMVNRIIARLRNAGVIRFHGGGYSFAAVFREKKTASILPFPKKPKRR
jgi:biotin operon repressor